MGRLSRQASALSGAGLTGNYRIARYKNMKLSVPDQSPTTNQEFWKSHVVGNYIYYAAGTAGILVFHVSDDGEFSFVASLRMRDPGSGVYPDGISTYDTRGITNIGDKLFVTAWKFTDISNPANINPGYIAAYDISDPANLSNSDWISTLEATPIVADETPGWIQDPVTDGEFIYVAAQYDGMYVIDPDLVNNCANMVEYGAGMHANADHPPTFWEASNITITADKQHVIMSNHGTGGVAVSIINIANPAIPILTRRINRFTAPNGDPLRVRSVDAYGEYLYCSTNSDGDYLNSPYRGLLVLDISDPANIPTDGSTWIPVAIAEEDQDNEYEPGHSGDSACVGVYRYGDYVYVSNGHNGVAVFSVKTPTDPKYMGILVTCPCIRSHQLNIYHAHPFNINGDSYLIYGTGPESVEDNLIFLDKITISK